MFVVIANVVCATNQSKTRMSSIKTGQKQQYVLYKHSMCSKLGRNSVCSARIKVWEMIGKNSVEE